MNARRRVLVAAVMLALAGPVLPAFADSASYGAEGVTRVRFKLPGELTIRQGTQEKLVVDAEAKVLQQLDISVKGDQLVIGAKGNFKTDKGLKLTLTLKALRSLVSEGSGGSSIDGFGGNAIEVEANGSGDIRLRNVKPAQLSLAIKGSGNVSAAGSGNSLDARIDGSGNIDAADFEARSVQAKIGGSGEIRVHAEQRLDAAISGAGNIEYKGKAKVTQSITGAGSVDRL
ncbi:MAG TPA: head GIN domain-containing protein [Noviherbaspirillum sp.]|uniref:head GIN domain-containing protein n=1 Tax=Noviherbaspirillum sp. TaxID=1926288 RepID=UPI002F91EE37